MDFEKEMHAFTDWIETNPLGPSTQTLWFHLMMIANKSGYPEWFAVNNPLLQAKVGVSENTFSKHRNYLVQKGRIEYKSQGKQNSGKYRIIPFTSNIAVKCEVKHEVKCEVKHEVKGSANKDLKDLKQATTAAGAGEYESFSDAHKRIFGLECHPHYAERLGAYIDQDGMEEAIVIRALERAAMVNTIPRPRLVEKILNDYLAANAKTLSAAKALDEAFEAKKGGKSRHDGDTEQIDDELDKLLEIEEERKREHNGDHCIV